MIQQAAHVSLVFLLLLVVKGRKGVGEALLATLDIPCWIQFQTDLSIPYHILAYSDNMPLSLPSGLSHFPYSVSVLLCQFCQGLLAHPYRSSGPFY